MLKILQSILRLIALVFALNILFAHIQSIWYKQSSNGWCNAISSELGEAWIPMLISILVMIIFIISEILTIRAEKKERKEHKNELKEIYKLMNEIRISLESLNRRTFKQRGSQWKRKNWIHKRREPRKRQLRIR
ncbi:hypothetical protein X792_01285 [Dehalococcoides mccartyi CG1]|nr:hypothetical protein X792_01285 [Dehalococcoides mccartyi CG1]